MSQVEVVLMEPRTETANPYSTAATAVTYKDEPLIVLYQSETWNGGELFKSKWGFEAPESPGEEPCVVGLTRQQLVDILAAYDRALTEELA